MINQLFHIIDDPDTVLIVGTGNSLRRDDGIGVHIAKILSTMNEFRVLVAESGLTNYIGKINSFQPDKLIIIDAATLNREAGCFEIFPIQEVREDTANSHTFSLRKLAGLLLVDDVYVLGIQPGDISVGTNLSDPLLESAEMIIKQFHTIFRLKLKTINHEKEF